MTIIRREKKVERKEMDDATKYKLLSGYSEGISLSQLARELGISEDKAHKFVQKTLREMNTVRETNDMIVGHCTPNLKKQLGAAPTKFLTSSFLSLVETNAEIYAYFFAQTGDNKFALQESGLDVGIHKAMKKGTKEYVYRIRGQFLRDIPVVKQIIKEEQDRRIKEYNIEKPQVQMELVHQIEQLKEAAANDPRQRVNLLKAIEMLGRSIGAFTDRVETVETDARSGLEILMEKVKGEVYEQKEN